MFKCETTMDCPGHGLGKFDSCLVEALYLWSLDSSYYDDATGDVDWGTYATLFLLEEDSELIEIAPDVHVRIPEGGYVLESDSHGFVYLFNRSYNPITGNIATSSESLAYAQEYFDDINTRYVEWLDSEEENYG